MVSHGLLKNTAGYVTLERKNYQADAVKYFLKIDDAFTFKYLFRSSFYNTTQQWRLVAFINGGASKTIIEMSKSSIHRLPKFKGGVNKFLVKNAIFAVAISIL